MTGVAINFKWWLWALCANGARTRDYFGPGADWKQVKAGLLSCGGSTGCVAPRRGTGTSPDGKWSNNAAVA